MDNSKTAAIVESYQIIRDNLIRKLADSSGCHVVTVSSPCPAEGKTMTAINLAVALSKAGLKTLIVDIDLKGASVQKRLNIRAEAGLCNLLSGLCELDGAISSVSATLDVITAGYSTPKNFEALICSDSFENLISSLRFAYDFIIIDSASSCFTAPTRFAAKQSDGTVLVLRDGHTKHAKIAAAVKLLESDRVKLLGTVINASSEKL